jgi:hypothetical protein
MSQIPKPLPREEQHLKPPSDLIEESEESGESEEEESFSEDKLPADSPKQSQFQGQESSEEEQLVNPEHYLKIKKLHFKSDSSSPEELEPSTA